MTKKTLFSLFICAMLFHSISLPNIPGNSYLFAADFKSDFKAFPFAARPAAGTIADCSYMNTPITEDQRICLGDDGHLYAAGKRIRIFGTNLSSFPSVEDAEYWAKTIAAQGYNCVRFHHTDSDWAECFFIHDKSWKTATFDESSFERFDKFFYELKKAGIYSNINLLTGRTIRPDAENKLPQDLNKVSDWKDQHCYGFWNELGREDQRKYAEKILNHKNPYTGLTYAQDPAVAFVEINNENSMTKCYLDGALSRFPESLTSELNIKWTDFLYQKGLDYEQLDKTYNQHETLGKNLISGKSTLEQHSGAKATLTQKDGVDTIQVTANGSESWHIQYDFFGFTTEAEVLYTISFKAKASKESDINVSVMMNHDPWANLGLSKNVRLTKNWQDFSYTVSTLQADTKPRLTFGNMGISAGTTFEFSDVKVCKGGSAVAVEKADMKLAGTNKENKIAFSTLIKFPSSDTYKGLPLNLRLLVTEFLVGLDDDYWSSMNDYLKKDLKIKALTFGTALPCAPVSVMNKFDVVDSHAYWHHPTFPGSSWNNKDYYVKNQSLVSDNDGGTLTNLAKLRVYGKPFSVTEYDHPYPSQFSAEMMPMLAVMASLQDWDCLYSFCYDLSQKNPETIKITGYFDQANNPAKIAGVPVAARIFREFRISPFEKAITYTITPQTELKAIAQKGSAWNNVPPECFVVTDNGGLDESSGGGPEGVSLGKQVSAKDALFARLGAVVLGNEQVDSAGLRGSNLNTSLSRGSDNNFEWNSRYGYFVYSDDDVFVSVTLPGAARTKGAEKLKEKMAQDQEGNSSSPQILFLPDDDFASVAGVKTDDSRWLIFSCSWSGNQNEKLFEYGKKPANIAANSITRSTVNLTTSSAGSGSLATALGSSGKIVIQNKAGINKNWKLYSLNPDGSTRKKEKTLELHSQDGTLWYELK